MLIGSAHFLHLHIVLPLRVASGNHWLRTPCYRFLASMPSGWIFITFCILLRSAEGVGAAMFITAAFTLLPQMFPSRVGFLMVGNVDCM